MINYSAAAELLFPVRCAGCGDYAGRPICPRCTASLPLIRGNTCARCGSPSVYDLGDCAECRGRMEDVDGAVALAVYREPLRSMIHKLKYGNGWRLASPLGAMAAVRLSSSLPPEPLLTHVPMHRRKERARGYDHAERLARGVGKALGLPAVPLLERTRVTRAQSSLSPDGRRDNVRGAFRVTAGGLEGREVVIVDDVLTTGSTLSECAAVLKGRGVARVTACVLARDMAETTGAAGYREVGGKSGHG